MAKNDDIKVNIFLSNFFLINKIRYFCALTFLLLSTILEVILGNILFDYFGKEAAYYAVASKNIMKRK